jgi:hypothetical protein
VNDAATVPPAEERAGVHRSADDAPEAAGSATIVMRGALAVLVGALLSFAAWQYLMPPTFQSSWGLNHAGLEQFRQALGVRRPSLDAASFGLGFRLLLAVTWAAYLGLLVAGGKGGRLPAGAIGAAGVALALCFGLLFPPCLSSDVYGYVGFGRLAVVHGMNPHLTSQSALVGLRDPVAPFLAGDVASPYGPLWTWISALAVWSRSGVLAEVVALKLVGACAVVGLAFAARALAARFERRKADLAFAAVALNPLFLIEGAGNGHNDLMMMALVVWGLEALAAAHSRPRVASLLIGCAAAIKLLPLLLVPWLVVHAATTGRGGRTLRAPVEGGAVLLLALAPLAVTYAPFWRGAATLTTGLAAWMSEGHRDGGRAGIVLALFAYLVASLWVMRRADPDRISAAWIAVVCAILIGATGVCFPWYLAWPWSASLARWDRRRAITSYVLLGCAVVLTLRYSIVAG